MTRLKSIASALVVPVAVIGVLTLGVNPTEAQGGAVKRTVYSVKFLCGEFQPDPNLDPERGEGPVKPGNYQTAINIHNPTQAPIVFVKSAVLLFSNDPANPVPPPGTFELPLPPGNLFSVQLPERWGLEIDCPDIRQVLLGLPPQDPALPPVFLKGYVVLETFGAREQLDVVAVYTTHGFTPQFGDVCSLPGSPLDGLPCDPADPNDPCIANGGACVSTVVGKVEEGFSTDIEAVVGKDVQ